MTRTSMKRFSILGVVLIAASAVTAAVLPSKASTDKGNFGDPNADGTVTTSTSGLESQTCAPRNGAAAFNCHITANSGTTGVGSVTDDFTTV